MLLLQQSGVDTLLEATTFRIDQSVWTCSKQFGDGELLARPSIGDIQTPDGKYQVFNVFLQSY